MARSYLNDAKQCLEKIKYYFENAGSGGYAQASHYFSKLGECHKKGSASEPGIAYVLRDLHAEGSRLMDAMKEREKGTPDGDDAAAQ